MKLEVRKAKEEDLEILMGFEKGIIKAERPFDNTLKEGEFHYYDLMKFIKNKKSEILIAVIANEIVGSGYVKIIKAKTYQKYDEYAYLGFMYVKPSFRGQGINQEILQQLIDWSKSQNITEVRLNVYDENIIAKESYLKKGFKANFLEMRLEI